MIADYLRVAAATPNIKVADCKYNTLGIKERIIKAAEEKVSILAFPELCITGYTCGDLFLQETLLKGAKEALLEIIRFTETAPYNEILIFVGLPLMVNGKLYNVAAALKEGKLLGLVPKRNLPNYSEFYEQRHFCEGAGKVAEIELELCDSEGKKTYLKAPFGGNILYKCEDVVVGCELCEDAWVCDTPATSHVKAGANIIVNCSASDETTGKAEYRRQLISSTSARMVCGYVYSNAGEGESTQDLVFGGHSIIAENGNILKEAKRFENGLIVSDIDMGRLISERRRMTTYHTFPDNPDYCVVSADITLSERFDYRYIDKMPFVPSDISRREERCEEILDIQTMGLKKRYAHTGCKNAVIGISGGLDSTLALLVTVRTFDRLSIPRENILAVTMPCFGTTDRTYNNAVMLSKKLGVTLYEVDLKESVTRHFLDIGHDIEKHDVTYENGQARERTQVLMDLANKVNGMVIGTGDMSELALGWATYNGDHMSMYGVNASVPKTLVRHLVRFYADTVGDEEIKKVLYDVLDTPVSPELLPPKEGQISQKTEEIVGPYELHDFFMYYVLRFGYMPSKIFVLACKAFEGDFDEKTIYKWLDTFYRRFFAQHFKRSCLPDGPKVGSVAVSPRGDLRMPSDASRNLWISELESVGRDRGLI